MATQARTFAASSRLATDRTKDPGLANGEERGAEEGGEGGLLDFRKSGVFDNIVTILIMLEALIFLSWLTQKNITLLKK